MSSFDVDKFREVDENPSRWDLRKIFLLTFSSKFPEDKLVHLSKCFVSIELDGSMYSDPVMKEIEELRKEMPDIDKEEKDTRKRKFTDIKETNSPSVDNGSLASSTVKMNTSTITPDDSLASSSQSTVSDVELEQQTVKKIKSDSDSVKSAMQNPDNSDIPKPKEQSAKKEGFQLRSKNYYKNAPIDEKFEALGEVIRSLHTPTMNAMELVYQAAPKVKLAVQYETYRAATENYFECVVRINYVEVGRVKNSKKRMAEYNAFIETKQRLLKKYHRVVSVDLDKELDKQFIGLCKAIKGLQNCNKTVFDIMYFAIRSVKPRMAIQVDMQVDNREHCFECVVSVNCVQISKEKGQDKSAAKNNAFVAAHKKLLMKLNNEISIKVQKLDSSDTPFST